MVTFAASTQFFGAQELGERHLRMIKDAGFAAVEVFAAPGHLAWDDEPAVARVGRALRSLGLAVASLHAPWAPGQDIAALDAAQRERSLRAAERAVDAVLALGGDVLGLHPGALPAGPAPVQLLLAEQGIDRVARYAASRRARVALENPPPYELGGDWASLLTLYGRFAAVPAVQACFDTGHAHLQPEGVAAAEQVPKGLLLVHLSDNAGTADDHLPPGTGTIRWAPLFSALRRRRFDGTLVLELTDLPEPETVLQEGRRWMERQWKQSLS